jgi:hypothetical protein
MGKILFSNTKLQLHVSLNACMSIIAKGKIIKKKKCNHWLCYANLTLFSILFQILWLWNPLHQFFTMIIIQSFLSFAWNVFIIKYISSNCSKSYSFKEVLILLENINSEANWTPKLRENKNSKVYMASRLVGAVKIQLWMHISNLWQTILENS